MPHEVIDRGFVRCCKNYVRSGEDVIFMDSESQLRGFVKALSCPKATLSNVEAPVLYLCSECAIDNGYSTILSQCLNDIQVLLALHLSYNLIYKSILILELD